MEKDTHPHILSGLTVRDSMKNKLIEKVSSFSSTPKLIIIQVGGREDSNIYIKQKINFGKSIGVLVEHVKFPESIKEDQLKIEIEKYNKETDATGIIIQLPLPTHIPRTVIDYISPKKDVDRLTRYHQEQLQIGNKDSAPPTAKAILSLLLFYKIPIKDKHVVVIGRSKLVGGPTKSLLEIYGARVSVIHSKTEDPKSVTKTADVLVVACGVAHLVSKEWIDVQKNTVIIDVGIHKIEGKIIGDVDFESVSSVISAISPVPGGVGPLTVTCLFQNLLHIHEISHVI
ncbi:MAG: bifunctional 5,10-methylenetetrahydrofolate dehydrogenase/5,10-methenyltetrahydrofolate cyclohydrolase [Minisyncoccota bacterium]